MRAIEPLFLFLAFILASVAQTPVAAQYENLPGVPIYSNVWGQSILTAVVAGAYRSRQAAEGRIDLRDRTGNLTGSIKTGSYIPQQVVFAPDHTIWAVCYVAGKNAMQDFKVLHHYARTGEELGQALSWSEVGGDPTHPVIESVRGGQLLYVAKNRIGWNAAVYPGIRTWLEVHFAGSLLGKYDVRTAEGLAVWPSAMAGSFRNLGGVLIGSEGDNLVVAQIDGASASLKYTASSSLRAE